jgi:hypothetical protein
VTGLAGVSGLVGRTQSRAAENGRSAALVRARPRGRLMTEGERRPAAEKERSDDRREDLRGTDETARSVRKRRLGRRLMRDHPLLVGVRVVRRAQRALLRSVFANAASRVDLRGIPERAVWRL